MEKSSNSAQEYNKKAKYGLTLLKTAFHRGLPLLVHLFN